MLHWRKMVSKRFVLNSNGKLVEIGARQAVPVAPYVHQDTMAPLKNLATGKIHDSKSAYLEDAANAGCRVIGNDLVNSVATLPPDTITEEHETKAMERAEWLCETPNEMRNYKNEHIARIERMAETGVMSRKEAREYIQTGILRNV